MEQRRDGVVRQHQNLEISQRQKDVHIHMTHQVIAQFKSPQVHQDRDVKVRQTTEVETKVNEQRVVRQVPRSDLCVTAVQITKLGMLGRLDDVIADEGESLAVTDVRTSNL